MLSPTPPCPIAYLAIARSDAVLQRLPAAAWTWLSDSEQSRLQSLRVAARRNHFLAGHWLVRELLVHAFAGSTPATRRAENWSLREIKSQAPRVLDHDELHLSISHSGNWVAAAVAKQPVGIDLEQRPRTLDRAIQDLLLNPNEAPENIDNDELLQRWVAKEAWLKMRGEGALPQRLRQLHLHASSSEFANVISYRSAHFHFAVATASMTTLAWANEAGATQSSAYRLEHGDHRGAMIQGPPQR